MAHHWIMANAVTEEISTEEITFLDILCRGPNKNLVNDDEISNSEADKLKTDKTFKRKIVWFNAIGFLFLHILALWGVFKVITFTVSPLTWLWFTFISINCGLCVTMGAHRLWSHKAFKAKWPLRAFLLFWHTVVGQNCLYIWVRDHRQHHKFSDTDADPHNANNGFFFSHVGWLMSKKHPDVIRKGKTVDMSDLDADPMIMFQKKHYTILYLIFSLFIPTIIPFYFWNESLDNCILVVYIFRMVLILNGTWSVNSFAHLIGNKPYNKDILAVESSYVSTCSFGEGWHNYHHSFPWDYRASEFGVHTSFTTQMIDFCARRGWIYDLRTTSDHLINSKINKRGDGSHRTIKKQDIECEVNHF